MVIPAIHPGEHLAEELKVVDMSAVELARQLNVPANRITQIINGTRAVTGDTADAWLTSLARVPSSC
jgi:addiction module HigA family antidote